MCLWGERQGIDEEEGKFSTHIQTRIVTLQFLNPI